MYCTGRFRSGRPYIRTYIDTYIHAYIHTFMHAYRQIERQADIAFVFDCSQVHDQIISQYYTIPYLQNK